MAETILTSETSVRKPGLSKCFRSVDQNYIVHVIVKENIEEATIQTVNNTTIIVLFLVFCLFQECRLSRKLDNKSFCDRLDSCLRQNAHYSRPLVRRSRDGFAIHHYADSVCYNVNGLIEKNKVDCLSLFLTQSHCLFQTLRLHHIPYSHFQH